MIKLEEIKIRQKDFIQGKIIATQEFITNIIHPTNEILSCFLSGSVARGDYWPREKGGAIDLILFVVDRYRFKANKILGKDLEPKIPGHFIKFKDNYFQIKIYDNEYINNFQEQPESEKYAFIESKILFDRLNNYQGFIEELRENTISKEIENNLNSNISYVQYLISPYKVDRWKRRNAIIQLNQNLNSAIKIFIKILFYINKQYAPAEDRALYYSFSLKQTPKNYEKNIKDALLIISNSVEDYSRREELFREKLLCFLDQYVIK